MCDAQELIAELLRNAAAISAHHGFSLEEFVEFAAAAYVTDQGEILSDFMCEAVVEERPPSN